MPFGPPGASHAASKSAFWNTPFRTPGGRRGSPDWGTAGAASLSPGDCKISDDESGCDTSCPAGDDSDGKTAGSRMTSSWAKTQGEMMNDE
jgi:hypothetical protein